MGTVKNLSYFKAEADKNRDMWKHADSGETVHEKKSDWAGMNMYATGKFDDVIRYQAPKRLWQSADGDEVEYEDEEYFEPEGEEMMVEEEFVEEELPKFRQLVRAKKLEYKAQYGKAHFGTRRECKNVPYPGTCYKRVCAFGKCADVPYPCTKYKEVCVNVPVWVWGWRKKWREFKQAGGLAQLKMISRGMMPLNAPVVETPTPTPTGSGPRGGTGRSVGESVDLNNPQLDLGNNESSQASVTGNIIGTVLILGLVFGAIKMMK